MISDENDDNDAYNGRSHEITHNSHCGYFEMCIILQPAVPAGYFDI